MELGVFRRMEVLQEESSETPDHRRLRRRLEGWAESLGFSKADRSRWEGLRPDVVRCDDSGKWLFLGDAAMSDHERPDRPGVKERIAACAAQYAFLVRTEQIAGGRIAVATNSEKTADLWVRTLQEVFARQGLQDAEGAHPDFLKKRLSPKTWVVYW